VLSVASALVAGNDALPGLAVRALAQALEKAAATRANGVLLFLTPEFSLGAQQTVSAVARAARCTQVVGGVAAGVFTDGGWVLDRPAAAVMVFTGSLTLAAGERDGQQGEPLLCYAGNHFPRPWTTPGRELFGGSYAAASSGSGNDHLLAWQQSRLAACCRVHLRGAHIDVGVSPGWRLLGGVRRVDSSRAYQLLRVDGEEAATSLAQAVREAGYGEGELAPAISALGAVLVADAGGAFADNDGRPISIIDRGDKGALTLAERVAAGQTLAWAIRLPQAAAEDMRQTVARLARLARDPVGAVVFSCIGRGPYFYGGQDHDLDCLRERFPRLPLIGSYGTGQIATRAAAGRRLMQNAVVTAVLSPTRETIDVQSQP